MFSTVEMARLTVAGSVSDLDEVLRRCANLGNIHVTAYSGNEDGISVGTPHGDADEISSILAKARAAKAGLSVVNKDGPLMFKEVERSVAGSFESDVDEILKIIESDREAEAEITRLEERVDILSTLAPLDIPLELMTTVSAVEVYVATCSKPSKIKGIFSDLKGRIEMHVADGAIAVACESKDAAEVTMAFGELGTRPIQIPTGEGKPSVLLSEAEKEISDFESSIQENESRRSDWAKNHGRNLLAVIEYLEREEAILTGHNLCAVSDFAYALEGWVPLADADKVKNSLSKVSSHLTIEPFVDDHHGHHDDGHDDHHETEYPPIEFNTIKSTRHASLLVDLVGRPKYGTIDPTSMMAVTFPLFYGLILGDAGYGICIMLLALFLKDKIIHNPAGAHAYRILMNMGISTFIVGVLCAEAFGFLLDGDDSIFYGLYHATKEATYGMFDGTVLVEWFGLSHTYIPFHRASGALMDYILLSIYLGCAHILVGLIIGFINVFKAHGFAAAFFEKGSWLLILFGGSAHILRMMTDESYGTFEGSIWSMMVIAGVICLIIGLAIFEKFGWAGGVIMGPIETFGLLANTLSYLRIMAVGVAGVKIAEIGNDMGFHAMQDAISSGDWLFVPLFFMLWIGVQVFALALGLLSPSIHAARLHFVEWMGKFHDGSGEAFSPMGGRPLHVEGHKS